MALNPFFLSFASLSRNERGVIGSMNEPRGGIFIFIFIFKTELEEEKEKGGKAQN